MPPIKLWRALLEPVRRVAVPAGGGPGVDGSAIDTLWTWDHLYPIVGNLDGPDLRGLADDRGLGRTTRARPVGLMVGANTFREPGARPRRWRRPSTTSARSGDPRDRCRVVRDRARRLRLRVRRRPARRLRWLGEALPVMRGMLHGEGRAAAGPHTRPRTCATTRRRCSAPAAADRRRRGAGHARSSPATPTRTTSAAASTTSGARNRSFCSIARRSAATRPRSNGRPGSASS